MKGVRHGPRRMSVPTAPLVIPREAPRGCGWCIDPGKRCPDCSKHLAKELRLPKKARALVIV